MARVLIACEFSGVVRRAFRARGHDAYSCDLLPAEDNSEHHITGDVLDVLDGYLPPGLITSARLIRWDVLIAFPPCTYLCSSGLHWNKRRPGRELETEKALAFVRALLDAPIERIALENPIGRINTAIRRPDQIIQPWQFGHDASKSTCLWLKNLPPLKSTRIVAPRYVCRVCGNIMAGYPGACSRCADVRVRVRWGNQTNSGQNKLPPTADRWKLRSITVFRHRGSDGRAMGRTTVIKRRRINEPRPREYWDARANTADIIDRSLAEHVRHLLKIDCTAAARAVARARKSVQGAVRHARGRVYSAPFAGRKP